MHRFPHPNLLKDAMKNFAPAASLFALATMLSAIPALSHAAEPVARATSVINQFKFELIDLRPDDGIDPWMEITEYSYTSILGSDKPSAFKRVDSKGEQSIDLPGISVTSVAGDSVISSTSTVFDYERRVHSTGYRGGEFVLSPWTALHISAVGTVTGQGDAPSTIEASVALAMKLNGVYDDVRYALRPYETDGAWWLSVSRSTRDEALSGAWGANAVTLVVSQVPEPSTYGMLLAGAGIIGAVARRRSRNQRA